MKPITKETIKRLYESPIDISLWNGCFNRAKVVAKFARHTVELTVYVTHPYLTWQCGDKNEVVLIDWRDGIHQPIPKELDALVLRMKETATMTNDEAAKLSDSNKRAFAECMRELGIAE